MATPPTFEEFEVPARRASPKEREAAASATKAEAAAAVAPELTQAQLRALKLQADKAEADLAADAAKAADAEKKKGAAASKAVADREQALLLLKLIQQARDEVSARGATGVTAQVTGGLFGSPAKDLDAALEPIRSDVVLDAMAQARIGSAAGATGFGALDRGERAMLASARGALSADQSPEKILQSLENIDRVVRAGLAREAGYDPYTPEGAALFGLPMPEGTEDLPMPSSGDVTTGRWEKRPELAGIDAAVTSMIKAGRSAAQIRQYLNEYQPGLGDKATNIEANIDYWKKTGEDPGVTIERYFVQEEPGIAEMITDNPVGAGVQAALNEASIGVSGLIPGETGQQIRAVQRGLAAKYPAETTIGNIVGSVASGVGGVGVAGRLGAKLPRVFEGVVQEGLRGAFKAEPGERVGGAAEGSLTALGGNVILRPVADVVGGVLRGAAPDAATLSQKYGVTLTPGQLSGVDEGTAAGLPIVGGQVQARRNESLIDFNRAAFNEVLKPIGASVDTVGQKGVAQAQDAVSQAYDRALNGRVFQFDPPFVRTVQGAPYATLSSMKGEQGPKAAAEIDRILKEINDNGNVDGRAWQQARRQLVDLQSANEIKDAIGGAAIIDNVGDIIDAFDGLVKRQAPDVFEDYMAANTAYRGVKVLERAVDFAPRGDVFGPGNLRSATRQNTNKFGGSAASARGERPLNELVMSGLNVIPERVDEVSLTGRLFPVGAGAGVGLGGMSLLSPSSDDGTGQNDGPSYLPPELLAAGAGMALTALPYSRGSTGLINKLMGGQRSRNQELLGELVSRYYPAALRSAFIGGTYEPGAPMPQEPVSPDVVVSPEMRAAVLGAGSPPAADSTEAFGGFTPQYEEAEPTGEAQSTVVIDGRVADRDPATGQMIFVDTGEPVPGFKRGGAAKGYQNGGRVGETAFQRRQREQQERQAASTRRVQQRMEADRQQRLAANQRNVERARAAGRGQTVSEGRGYNTNAARARTALQGLTLASGDEAEAALREGMNALTEMRLPTLAGYYGIKDDINRGLERYAADNPGEALLFEGGGAALTGLIPGAQGATAARLAALASRYPTRAALARLGAESAAYGVGAADRPSDVPRSVAEEGVLASLMYGGARVGGAGVRKGAEFATRASNRGAAPQDTPPTIENIIAYPKFAPEGAPVSLLYGRPMRSAEEATYASRNMSLAEIEDALASGVFRLPPSGETRHGVGKKWWSPADEEGVFGRTWAKGSGTVRVPMSAFTPDAPLSVKAAQRWDDEVGAWVPMVPSDARKARGGLAVKKAGKK